MRHSVLIGGKAGQGINEVSLNFEKTLLNEGFYAFMYRDYGSFIAGQHNFNIVTFSDKEVNSHDEEYDVIIAFDENTLTKHEKNLKKEGTIISETKGIKFNLSELIEKNNLNVKASNMVLAGILCKLFGLKLKSLEMALAEKFKDKVLDANIKAIEIGYNFDVEKKFNIKAKSKHKDCVFSGSETIAMGAVASGLDVYIAYPMTPATPVLNEIICRQISKNVFVYYPENEIAVANAALGTSFTGASVMVGTSGGGYDLMTEAISMQGISEIPLVVYLAQRAGPGTGIPTYNMQCDMHDALKSSHGEFSRVVVAPGDPIECVELTNQAFYLSQKYRVVSIILTDKHIAESYFTANLNNIKIKKIEKERPKKSKKGELADVYQITKSGISPRYYPGKNLVKMTSYEHDEKGITIEDAETATKMFDKRKRKKPLIEAEVKKMQTIKTYGNKNAEKLLVGWGSTKGALTDYVNENKDYKFLQILYLEPFDAEKVKVEIKKAKNVFVVENNATSQLSDLIAEKTGIIIKDKQKILRYDGRPFTIKYLNEKLK